TDKSRRASAAADARPATPAPITATSISSTWETPAGILQRGTLSTTTRTIPDRMPARLLERLTKLVVLAWTAAALVVEVSQLAAAWPELPALAIGLFVVACDQRMFTSRAIGLVL